MKKSEAKSRIEQLSAELKRHNHNYYVLNSPEITDFQYDLLMLELQELEKMFPEFAHKDSPSVNVGSDLSAKEQFERSRRCIPRVCKRLLFIQFPLVIQFVKCLVGHIYFTPYLKFVGKIGTFHKLFGN